MLRRQTGAVVSVGTYWPWETVATLRLLGGARRFGDQRRTGAGHIVAAARLQLISISIISIKLK